MNLSSTVCTLFEGSYHYGVAALANSLFRHGYRGTIHVGYRGSLPAWMKSPDDTKPATVQVVEGLTFCLHPLRTPWHLTNYKPEFIKSIFAEDPAVSAVFYFDPDIVVKCGWTYYEEWVQNGIALVEEIVTHGMPYNHPIRQRWLELAQELQIVCHPKFSQYFNGGFIGMHRQCQDFLDTWTAILRGIERRGIDLARFMPVGRPHPFCGTDQDALNIMAMAAEPHLSTMGPEGMDFIPGGFTMSHAVGPHKPWSKKFLQSALKGIKPTMADKTFWENVSAPIRVYPESVISRRRKLIRLASFIGRFYHQ